VNWNRYYHLSLLPNKSLSSRLRIVRHKCTYPLGLVCWRCRWANRRDCCLKQHLSLPNHTNSFSKQFWLHSTPPPTIINYFFRNWAEPIEAVCFCLLSTLLWASRRQEASTAAIRSPRRHFSPNPVLFWVFRIFSLSSLTIPSWVSLSLSTPLRVFSSVPSFGFPVCQASSVLPFLAFFTLPYLGQFRTIPSTASLLPAPFLVFRSILRCRSWSRCLPSQPLSPHSDDDYSQQATPSPTVAAVP